MPKFTHDCDRCQFVATVANLDLYTCPDSHGYTSYIARYASEGGSYASMCDWPRDVPIESFRGFQKKKLSMRETIKLETGGLSEKDLDILTTFRLMPCLLLNMAIHIAYCPVCDHEFEVDRTNEDHRAGFCRWECRQSLEDQPGVEDPIGTEEAIDLDRTLYNEAFGE